jgi:hypothetical protein
MLRWCNDGIERDAINPPVKKSADSKRIKVNNTEARERIFGNPQTQKSGNVQGSGMLFESLARTIREKRER